MVETPKMASGGRSGAVSAGGKMLEMASTDQLRQTANQKRHPSGVQEIDRVLGGGIAEGCLALLVGEPGVGKSTLALQLGAKLGASGLRVGVFSGEESPTNIAARARRMGIGGDIFGIAAADQLEDILQTATQTKLQFLVVDSVQTLVSAAAPEAVPGTPAAVRAVTEGLMRFCNETGVPVLLIGQVTKEGDAAGPNLLRHLVDVIMILEGEQHHETRLLRATKNRFGSAAEVGLFEMREDGVHPLENPSAALLAGRLASAPGSVVLPAVEGSRAVMLEVQALVNRSALNMPRRVSNGFSPARAALLCAVLSRHARGYFRELPLGNADVFMNVVGGIKTEDIAADLAVCAAIAGAARGQGLPPDMALFGEVGLSGELRDTASADARLRECAQRGFTRVVLPAAIRIKKPPVQLLPAQTLADALDIALPH